MSHSTSQTPRTEGAGLVYDGKLYAVAGFERDVVATDLSEVFDPLRDSWSLLASIPYPVTHVGAALVDGRIWIVGGFEGDHPGPATGIVQIYDIATDAWESGPPLPSPRASGTLALLGRHLHYVGGLLPDRQTDVGDHYMLDVDNWKQGWLPAAPLPRPRNHLSSAVFEGRLYAIGGQFGHDDGRTLSPLVHVYDVTTDSWSSLAGLPLRRSHAEASTFVYNGRIIVAGGMGPGPIRTASLDLITAYDPRADAWTDMGTLPEKLLGLEAQAIGSRLFAANGSIGLSGNAQSSTWSMELEPRTPDTLGFWPNEIDVTLDRGQSTAIGVLLWTHHEGARFAVDSRSLPDWMSVVRPDSGVAVPSGTSLSLRIDASQLGAGIFRDTIVVSASGFPAASFPATLTVTADSSSTAVGRSDDGLHGFSLDSNYPNPFSRRTTIRYSLPRHAKVALAVYDLLGTRVALLVDENQSAGSYEVAFEPRHLGSGMYVSELRAGDVRLVRSMVMTK